MSSGMLLLAGLFATGPASAAPAEEAPMPRAKSGPATVEFRVDLTPRGLAFGAGVGAARPRPEPARIVVPPMCELAQCPADRAGPPPEVHLMMLQALEQMAGPPPACVRPIPMPATAAWTAPTRMPPNFASVTPTAGRMMPIGSWTREVGPVSYKIEIKGDTLIVTASLQEKGDDGKSFTVNHVLTADWYPTRTEHEIVGVVRGFDIAVSDMAVARDDVGGLLASLADIQKQLNGKPIALTCRVTESGLLIGDVRLPSLKDDYSELSTAFAAMGGNYKAPTTQPTLTQVEYRTPLARPALPPMPLPQPLPRSNPFRNGGY